MGRASTWHNRATVPLRIPKILAKAGTYLFRGIDGFIFTPEKTSECFQVTLKDDAGGSYLVEMVITRISATTTAIAPANLLEVLNTEAIVPNEDVGRDDDRHSSHEGNHATEAVAAMPINVTLVEPGVACGMPSPVEEATTGETTQGSSAEVAIADEVLAEEPSDPEFALFTFDLTEFGDQLYYWWHKLAENIQLPVWGCAIELDDIYRRAFGSMPGALFLKYLERLIEQETAQAIARMGLVHIPGQPSFPVGMQQVCALTFWSDWHDKPLEVNHQPVTVFLPEPTVQMALQRKPVQVTELNRLQTVLAQYSESDAATHFVPLPTTIERLRAERQQYLQWIKTGEENPQATSVQDEKHSVQHLNPSLQTSSSGLVAGLLGLFQKARS